MQCCGRLCADPAVTGPCKNLPEKNEYGILHQGAWRRELQMELGVILNIPRLGRWSQAPPPS